jgi:DNA adenine methylase
VGVSNTKTFVKTPLRYPGGKAKAISFLSRFIPEFQDYREPFVGGGSMFLYVKQQFPKASCWINDLNYDLYCFWKYAQVGNGELVREIQHIKNTTKDGKALFRHLTDVWCENEASEFDRAVRFFVLNRITFSGTVDSGGYSQKAFESRFTDSAILRLAALESCLEDVRITNLDYEDTLAISNADTFMFLDPPYLSATDSRLYGRRGALHKGFDHNRFAQIMQNYCGKWLLTYDDCAKIRENFSFALLQEWQLQYGMNNYKQTTAAKGKELLLSNYTVDDAFSAQTLMPF